MQRVGGPFQQSTWTRAKQRTKAEGMTERKVSRDELTRLLTGSTDDGVGTRIWMSFRDGTWIKV